MPKIMPKNVIFFIVLISSLYSCVPNESSQQSCSGNLQYELVVDLQWGNRGAGVHVTPPNPHFSPFFGTTHAVGSDFWKVGKVASIGMVSMAEGGAVDPLKKEFNASGKADCFFQGTGASGPVSTQVVHSQKISFRLNTSYPLVTVVSMIAPSPDWFVGISSYNLAPAGVSVGSYTHELRAYDAGSDSASNFVHVNTPTTPRQNITRLTDASLKFADTDTPIGTFVFTRK